MKIGASIRTAELRQSLDEAAGALRAEVVDMNGSVATGRHAEVVIVEAGPGTDLEAFRDDTRRTGSALIVACADERAVRDAIARGADDFVLLPARLADLQARIERASGGSASSDHAAAESAALVRYQELLYDKLTGFPTLPVMIERARDLLEQRGELTIMYIHFVWYEKVEEIYGWQKLDDVLESTAEAIRDFCMREHPLSENLMMVSHIADDDFILFMELGSPSGEAERRLRALAGQLGAFLRDRIESAHGEDIAALCGIYVGTSTLFRDPKIRTERLVYRGIREAAQAARGAEQWERTRKVADLKATLREEAVFIEYHPIIITATEEVYGYEALARGSRRELRSPEVLFEVAEEANMLWELSRLLRRHAVEGILNDLGKDQFLFLNIDPHDFDDPTFRNLIPSDLGITDPGKIVLEITERTAIKDYPRFQEYLAAFREQGFRFAVDDAGSGYAGLGSIANLAPDYIKLDISLISNIDTNFLKQNLVETMVQFAEGQNAKVIAEGVERREEFETVKQLGVHLTQGFLFHKPKYSGKQKTA